MQGNIIFLISKNMAKYSDVETALKKLIAILYYACL